jgi:hypothetical protein
MRDGIPGRSAHPAFSSAVIEIVSSAFQGTYRADADVEAADGEGSLELRMAGRLRLPFTPLASLL